MARSPKTLYLPLFAIVSQMMWPLWAAAELVYDGSIQVGDYDTEEMVIAAAGERVVVSFDFEPPSVYVRADGQWELEATLTQDDRQDIAGVIPLAFSGDTIVYGREVWRLGERAWEKETTLQPDVLDPNDQFGSAVAISGNTIVIGAPGEDSSDERNPNDNSLQDSGAVYVFHREGSDWDQVARLKATGTVAFDTFGRRVGISGDHFVAAYRYCTENRIGTMFYQLTDNGVEEIPLDFETSLTKPVFYPTEILLGEDRMVLRSAYFRIFRYQESLGGWDSQFSASIADHLQRKAGYSRYNSISPQGFFTYFWARGRWGGNGKDIAPLELVTETGARYDYYAEPDDLVRAAIFEAADPANLEIGFAATALTEDFLHQSDTSGAIHIYRGVSTMSRDRFYYGGGWVFDTEFGSHSERFYPWIFRRDLGWFFRGPDGFFYNADSEQWNWATGYGWLVDLTSGQWRYLLDQ